MFWCMFHSFCIVLVITENSTSESSLYETQKRMLNVQNAMSTMWCLKCLTRISGSCRVKLTLARSWDAPWCKPWHIVWWQIIPCFASKGELCLSGANYNIFWLGLPRCRLWNHQKMSVSKSIMMRSTRSSALYMSNKYLFGKPWQLYASERLQSCGKNKRNAKFTKC